MNHNEIDDREADKHDEWLFGGLAAICAAAVTQLGNTQTELFSLLGVSVTCFAFAIPLLTSSMLITRMTSVPRTRFRLVYDLTGIIVGVFGFDLLLFHVNLVAGGCFLIMVFASFFTYVSFLYQHR